MSSREKYDALSKDIDEAKIKQMEIYGSDYDEASANNEELKTAENRIREIKGGETQSNNERIVSKEKQENITIDEAKEIMGNQEVLGPVEIEQAFGIKVETKDIPKIPFSRADLERARELNQFLILRVDKDNDGNELTMKGVKDTLEARGYATEKDKTGKDKGKILTSESYDTKFFTEDPIKMQWALVSKEVIPSSTSKNYLEQTKEIKNHLQTAVFKDQVIPKAHQEAIEELDSYIKTNFKDKSEAEIKTIIGGTDWKRYAKELSELKINQLCRHTPAEVLYDLMAYFQTTGERLYEKMYIFTKRLYSDGRVVEVGSLVVDGACVNGYTPDYSHDFLGVSLSRSI